MIFLVGTHHERQHDGRGFKKDESTKQFIEFIKIQAKKLNISLIAEEFSKEALETTKATKSTIKEIAQSLKIDHLFCDPNSRERKKIGIPSDKELRKNLNLPKPLSIEDFKKNEKKLEEEEKKYFAIREKFWLNKLNSKLENDIIFVCGIQHLESFQELLSQNSLKSLIFDEKF